MVAQAQAYFAALAEIIVGYSIEHDESMDRLATREDISAQEVDLTKTAAAAGVVRFDYFKSAGYRGMYDMPYSELRKLRGVADKTGRSVYDFMGREELAANLFRLTLTEGRLKRDRTSNQADAEHVAEDVGRKVRNTMIEQTGVTPESLPTAQDIKIVRRGIKASLREFPVMDDLEGQKLIESQAIEEMTPDVGDDAVPGCPECASGSRVPHHGSPRCTSGWLASGGPKSHCTCEHCY